MVRSALPGASGESSSAERSEAREFFRRNLTDSCTRLSVRGTFWRIPIQLRPQGGLAVLVV